VFAGAARAGRGATTLDEEWQAELAAATQYVTLAVAGCAARPGAWVEIGDVLGYCTDIDGTRCAVTVHAAGYIVARTYSPHTGYVTVAVAPSNQARPAT
jgi:predicted deacylase